MTEKVRYAKDYGVLGIFCLLVSGGYLIYSLSNAGIGFPLDDAWIHQAFARNFVQSGTWSFQLGTPSGGSTGPLWGFILSTIYLLNFPEVIGTHIIGFLLLWGSSISAYQIGRLVFPGHRYTPLLIGILISLEWHLVWSALSGMETVLMILISLQVFKWILEKRDNWWVPGVMIGISIWVRPDGLTFLGPVLLALVFRKESAVYKLRSGGIFIGSLFLVGAPYFVFNYFVAGDFWPNTFYAKQAEYAVLRQASLVSRYLGLSKQAVTGIGIVLLPGLILEAWAIVKESDWEKAGILMWAAGYIGIYALRLPVVYQHGRYIMPAIPAFLLLGASGMARWVEFRSKDQWKRVISTAWGSSAAVVLCIFCVLGARAYALDVGIIETEMVQVALWINDNTPSNAVIGAHDIGGLGYFGDRQIIDLAGLISPDVIPFIRDENQLGDFLDEKGADYLVTFPGWYPELVQGLPLLYRGSGKYSGQFDAESMSVYQWKQAD